MKELICRSLCFLCFSAISLAESPPNFRLVATGGLQGFQTGRENFDSSPLFRLGSSSLFTINRTHLEAYTVGETAYFSADKIDPKHLIELAPTHASGSFEGLDATQFFGVKQALDKLVNFGAGNLQSELGGVSNKVHYEARKISSSLIYAVDFSLKQTGVRWPSRLEDIKKISAVTGISKNGKETYYFFPRDFRSTGKTFELVDQLLKKNPKIPTRFIDLGNALTRSDYENIDMATKMGQLLQARNPAALALGRYDLSALTHIPSNSAYIGALKGQGAPPVFLKVDFGNTQVQFLALGEISDLASGFLDPALTALTTRDSIKTLESRNDDLVIALSENSASAAQALEYPVLDLVLSMAYLRGGSLPARDLITLQGNQDLGVRSVAPLVRISSSDVTEISVWLGENGQIRQILIERYPIVGGLSAQETTSALTLPKKFWRASDFEEILSNVLLNAYPNAELVITEKRTPPTPIDAEIPVHLAEKLIAPQGRAIEISMGGTYLKQVLKAIKEDQFDLDVTVTNTVRRGIAETETYKIVVTEKVLAAISDFIARESLFASSTNPSSSVQTALAESNKDAMKFLTELRKRENKTSSTLGDRHALLTESPSITQLVRQAIYDKSSLEVRPERSVLVFDISDFDFGFKLNAVNSTLSSWQAEASDPKADATQTSKVAFDENRFWDKNYRNILLYSKIGLYYLMPKLELGLIGSIKYYHPDQQKDNANAVTSKDVLEIRPQKDSVKLEAEALVPTHYYLSPLFRLTYETQLWPNSLLTDLPPERWPRRVHDMRLFAGVSPKPRLGYELFRVGALLGYDFSRSSPEQSFGYGFELGLSYGYSWRYFGFKIDSNFRKLFPIVSSPDVGRMGIVWLTDAKIEVPIIAGFSVSALTGLTMGDRMDNAWDFGIGTVFGLALSYGNRLKWLL